IRDLIVTGVQTCALPISHPVEHVERLVVATELDERVAEDAVVAGRVRSEPHRLAAEHERVAEAMAGQRERTARARCGCIPRSERSEEHTSDSSHDQISYAVFCLKKKILTGLLAPTQGVVRVLGQPITHLERRRRIGY